MLKLKIPPTLLAVSLEDAKAHCRVEVADDDALIDLYIRAATEMAEQRVGRSIMPQTWLLTLDVFPAGAVLLRNIPVASIVSVTYIDTAGTETVLGTQRYRLSAADDYAPAQLLPARGDQWPVTYAEEGAVRIEYAAGYSTPAAVPHSVRSWILLRVAAMYENRESENVGNLVTEFKYVDSLLDRVKVWSL